MSMMSSVVLSLHCRTVDIASPFTPGARSQPVYAMRIPGLVSVCLIGHEATTAPIQQYQGSLLFVNDPLLQLGHPAQGRRSLTTFLTNVAVDARGPLTVRPRCSPFFGWLASAGPASISFVVGRPFCKSPGEVRTKNYGDDGLRRPRKYEWA